MRKQLLLMLLCLSATMVWAERIDVATARKVAENVASGNFGLRSAGDLSLVYAAAPGQSNSSLRSGTVNGEVDYFVFNIPGNKGFVIVSGEDRAYPVLGQSDKGRFTPDNLPDNLRAMLAYYQKQITYAERTNLEASADIQAEWKRYLDGNLRSSATVLLETANWDQEEPYNRQTPKISGQRTYTGCVATATAIIMRYHKYPTTAVSNGVTTYNGLSVNYTAYNWDNMPLNYTNNFSETEANAVAALMWNIGANVEMNYGVIGSGGSGATMEAAGIALNKVFGYSDAVWSINKSDFRWDEWKAIIRGELDNNRPLIYRGDGNGGHAFVCDGYKLSEESFHINWGWSGYGNGYFLLTALDPPGENGPYSNNMGMTIGISKPQSGDKKIYELKYMSLTASTASLSGITDFTVSFNFKNIGNDTFTGKLDVGVIGSDGNIKRRIATTQQNVNSLQAGYYYKNPWSLSCKLDKPLADDEKILPLYSADNGTSWKIMFGTADAPLYINKNGVINEGDDPNDPNVQPMNVSIYWNALDNKYLKVSGLDNSQYNYDNMAQISYSVTNATEDISLRYILKNYSGWNGRLAVYYGDEYNIYLPDQGIPVTIAPDGSFNIPVNLNELRQGSYINNLKILSDKAGCLTYDIQVYTKSDQINPIFEEQNKQMMFINSLEGKISPNPVIGTTNIEIPFTYTFDNVDPSLVGKELKLNPSLSVESIDQIKLYYVDGDQKKEIELTGNSGTYFYTKEALPVGNLTVGKGYRFLLSSSRVIAENEGASVSVDIGTVGNNSIPSISGYSQFIISGTSIKTHKVQTNLQNLIVQNEVTSVIDQKNLSLTLLPKTGYQLPASITVMMGGNILGTDLYNYNPENGYIYIYNVTSDVVISAAGVLQSAVYTITANLNNLTSTPDITATTPQVKGGDPFTFILKPATDYKLPDAITILNGNKLLVAGADYTYDATSGKVYINAVNANMTVNASGIDNHHYEVMLTLAGLTSNPSSFEPVSIDEKVELTLIAAEGYTLPATITVTMGNKSLIAGTDYTYNASTGVFSLAKVTGRLSITAQGVKKNYAVTVTLTNLTTDIPSNKKVQHGETLTGKLTAIPKYELPTTITVTIDDSPLTSGTDYTYDVSTGVFEIKNVNGDLNIKAAGVMKGYFEVVLALTNLISDPAFFEPLVKDSEVKFILKAASGYTLPTSITVIMGNNTLTSADYSYDSITGVFTLKKITDILVITAAGNKIPDPEPEPDPTPTIYTVTLPVVEGAILEAGTSTSVEAGKSFEFTLTLQAGYNASQLTVKANGSILTPVSNGHYVIEKVMSNIVVTITGIVKNDPTSNTEVDPDKLKVWGENGRLHIRTSISGTAYIVTLDGRLYKTLSLPAGETVTNVPQGLYIIHIGKRSHKIQL